MSFSKKEEKCRSTSARLVDSRSLNGGRSLARRQQVTTSNNVMVTYRTILFTSGKTSGELMQIGTEQLRDKRMFIYFPYCIFISLLGAIFKNNLAKYYIKPPF